MHNNAYLLAGVVLASIGTTAQAVDRGATLVAGVETTCTIPATLTWTRSTAGSGGDFADSSTVCGASTGALSGVKISAGQFVTTQESGEPTSYNNINSGVTGSAVAWCSDTGKLQVMGSCAKSCAATSFTRAVGPGAGTTFSLPLRDHGAAYIANSVLNDGTATEAFASQGFLCLNGTWLEQSNSTYEPAQSVATGAVTEDLQLNNVQRAYKWVYLSNSTEYDTIGGSYIPLFGYRPMYQFSVIVDGPSVTETRYRYDNPTVPITVTYTPPQINTYCIPPKLGAIENYYTCVDTTFGMVYGWRPDLCGAIDESKRITQVPYYAKNIPYQPGVVVYSPGNTYSANQFNLKLAGQNPSQLATLITNFKNNYSTVYAQSGVYPGQVTSDTCTGTETSAGSGVYLKSAALHPSCQVSCDTANYYYKDVWFNSTATWGSWFFGNDAWVCSCARNIYWCGSTTISYETCGTHQKLSTTPVTTSDSCSTTIKYPCLKACDTGYKWSDYYGCQLDCSAVVGGATASSSGACACYDGAAVTIPY